MYNINKNNNIYTFIRLFVYSFALLIMATSCNKMLEVVPESDITNTSFFKTLEEVDAGVIGCYSGLIKAVSNEWMLTELRSDNVWQRETGSGTSANLDLNDLDMFRPSAYMENIYTYWYNTYQNIANCNLVLEHLDVVVNADLKKQYENECRFIRAYHYFNLVRLFGPVFICDHSISPLESKKIDRSSVEKVYEFIIEDLEKAGSLPTSYIATQKGRATKWAAKALLGKIYLTLGDYTTAKTYLQDVVDNSGHEILPNFANVFATNNEMNNEIIFAIRHKSGGAGLGATWSNDFAPLNSQTAVVLGNGRGLNSPTTDLANAYDINDARKAVTIGTWLNSQSTEYLYPKKLVIPITLTNDSELDFPVLRFADVLLMLAECENELGNTLTALTLLDPLRNRAGLLPLVSSSQMQARLLIEKERRLELAFENQRFFDLVRTNRLKEVLEEEIFVANWGDHYSLLTPASQPKQGQIIQNWQALLPIPGREIDANNSLIITQNFGY